MCCYESYGYMWVEKFVAALLLVGVALFYCHLL